MAMILLRSVLLYGCFLVTGSFSLDRPIWVYLLSFIFLFSCSISVRLSERERLLLAESADVNAGSGVARGGGRGGNGGGGRGRRGHGCGCRDGCGHGGADASSLSCITVLWRTTILSSSCRLTGGGVWRCLLSVFLFQSRIFILFVYICVCLCICDLVGSNLRSTVWCASMLSYLPQNLTCSLAHST